MMKKDILRRATASLLIAAAIATLSACSGSGEETNPPIGDGAGEQIYEASEGLAYEMNGSRINECIITGMGTCTDENLIIPFSINGKRVVGIAAGAFSQKSAMPKSTENSIVKPTASYADGITGGFNNGVILPDEVEGEDEIIPGGTNGIQLKSVTIPAGITSIGAEAFYGCDQLDTISTQNIIRLIGKDAFKETAYYNDPANWDGAVLYLDDYLVEVKRDFKGSVTVKSGTTTIADRAFYECTGVTAVNIPASVKVIGNYSFYGCSSLKSLTIKNNQLDIKNNAFENCTSLISVELGLDEEIYEPAETADGGWYRFELTANDLGKNEMMAYAPSATDENGRPYVYATAISGGSVFKGCTSLKSVKLNNTVKGVVNGWFYNCTSVETIKLSDNITSIQGLAFANCKSLKNIDLGQGVTTIWPQTFYECDSLEHIVLPDKVESIEWISWFCDNLKSITFGSGFKKIEWAYPEIEVFYYNGTMEDWRKVDVTAMTNTQVVNPDGSGGTKYVRGSYSVVCLDGTIFEKNLMVDAPEEEEDTVKLPDSFVLIHDQILNTINSTVFTNYTEVIVIKDNDLVDMSITKVTDDGIYYVKTIGDDIVCELYGVKGDGDMTVYKKLSDGKWYRTTQTIDHQMIKFIYPLTDCTVNGDNTYTYTPSEDYVSSITVGFSHEWLSYYSIDYGYVSCDVYYTDYYQTVIDPIGDIVPDVIVDPNGVVIN